MVASLTTGTGDTFWYMSAFSVTLGGATAGAVVKAVITGLLGGTVTYNIGVPTGVTSAVSLSRDFGMYPPVQAVVGTPITLTVDAAGAGNTAASCALHGFRGDRQLA